MNCVNHPQAPATAYCRTCGKALCEECKRDVRGVIYCEDCIVARLSDTLPPVQPGAAAAVPVVVSSGPNPALAAVIAFFFPFGLGAVYNGQYGKGLAHMMMFVFIIFGLDKANAEWLFVPALLFYLAYQVIDAYQTAKAKQLGVPPPDPFGLNRAFGNFESRMIVQPPAADVAAAPGAPATPVVPAQPAAPEQPSMPIGPIILIGIGVLFLLRTMDILPYGMHKFWPLILIAVGVYLIMKQRGR